MGKYQPYPEYKNSSNSLLSEVPKHWQLTRVKYVSELTPKKPEVDRNLDCSFIAMEKLKTDSIVLDETKQIGSVYDGYTYFADGDILMAKVTPCFENKNIAIAKGLTNQIGFGSSEIYTIRTSNKVNNRFLFYRLQEDGFMDLAIAAMTGAGGLKRVPSETVANYTYASPKNDEQEIIASFLDHEIAKIDTLIEKQQQLIKLLKEKRQAVISHAVTKGLNPNAPMRDSGVEWLGEVPEHWTVGRYKFCTSRIVVGIAEAATHAYAEVGVPIIRSTNIREEGLDTSGMLFIKKEFAEKNRSKYLYANDVITVRTGYPGTSAVIPNELDESQCFTNLVSTPKKNISSAFLSEYLNSHTGKSYFDLLGWGSAQKNISVPILQNIPITWPDKNEQSCIMDYVQSQRGRYTCLVGKAKEQIVLLRERRTALISATVTGKIDVRNWTPSELLNTNNKEVAT
jgi:type I restriction enzyme S subunit